MNKHNKQIAMPVLGSLATNFYQAELERLSGLATLPLLLLETDFERINVNLPDKYKALTPLLGSLLERLEETSASIFLIPNITLHAAINRMDLEKQLQHKIINPVNCGIDHLKAGYIEKITLAGTRHTMQSNQLAEFFQPHDIAVQFPEGDDINELDAIRLQVFEEGYSRAGRIAMHRILSRYDNVVLACTELSILNSKSKFIDLAQLQIAAALKRL